MTLTTSGSGNDSTSEISAKRLVRPFADLSRHDLAVAGGKAANLGEMVRAGLPVPPGFCVTIEVYWLVAGVADVAPLVESLSLASDTVQAELAATIRQRFLDVALPPPWSPQPS